MRAWIFPVLFFSALVCSAQDIDDPEVLEEIVEGAINPEQDPPPVSKDGLLFATGSDVAYTGWVVQRYANGRLHHLTQIKDGKRHGLSVSWHRNGKKVEQGRFEEGVQVGVWRNWYDNGQLVAETTLKDGKAEGKNVNWHRNGKKKLESHYKNGKLNGVKTTWDSYGNIKSRILYRNGEEVEE